MELLIFHPIGAIRESLPGFFPCRPAMQKTLRARRALFVIAAFRWVAHASRVLVVASRDNELPRDADFTAAADAFFEKAGQQKLVAAGTPQPTRETRALPSETRQ